MELTNKKHIIAYSILSAVIVVAIVWVVALTGRNRALAIEVNNDYNRAFVELVDYVDGIETNLRKSMLVSSPAQLASISNEIFRESVAAKQSLGELPVWEVQLDNTAKFLSQVGDYTYVLSQNAINGEKISEEDFKNLQSLAKYAGDLTASLEDLLGRIYSGEVSLSSDTASGGVFAAGEDILSDMENVEKSFEEYPSLIYDGPFSEHIENREAQFLKNYGDITSDEAVGRLKRFLGDQSLELTFEGQTENTPINAYTYTAMDGSLSAAITKRGGHVLYFLKNREIKGENIDFSAAINVASKFLSEHGYPSMTNSYYDKSGGVATINFAYMQDGIVCYSDLIKVKVALDNGEVLGFEANGFIMNHAPRSLSAPKLSAQEARSKISPHLDVTQSGMALIPKDSMEEILCYEYHGSFDGRNFIIYINAQNGREEKILMLIESESGILTQ